MPGDGRKAISPTEQYHIASIAGVLDSNVLHNSPSVFTVDTSTASSTSEHKTSLLFSEAEVDDTWRDIAPYEISICDILTTAIHACASKGDDERHAQHVLPDYRPESIKAALLHTSSVIRFNAKWFTPTKLSTLLSAALDAVGLSSSSPELHAGLILINNIAIYAMIPLDCLAITARFLSYAHFQGNKSNRTKKLTDEAWAVIIRLLQSHLGAQFMDEFLAIVRDYATAIDRRVEYASSQGSITILRHILFFPRKDIPEVNLLGLLKSISMAAMADNNMLHEPITEVLVGVLSDRSMVERVGRGAGWDDLLAAAHWCVYGSTTTDKGAQALVTALSQLTADLEMGCLPVVGKMHIAMSRTLTPLLGSAASNDCIKHFVLTRSLTDLWRFVDQLRTVGYYGKLLCDIMDKSLNFILDWDDELLFDDFVNDSTLRMKQTEQLQVHSNVMPGEYLVHAFERCLEEGLPIRRRDLLFSSIAESMNYNINCTRMLFRLRADVEDHVYLENRSHSIADGLPVSRAIHIISGLSLQGFFTSLIEGIKGQGSIWEPYEFLLKHTAHLIGNRNMFESNILTIKDLRATICEQLDGGLPKFIRNENKTWVISRLLETLITVVSYHRHLKRDEMLQIVSVFIKHAGAGDASASVICVHGLTICCYEVPDLMSSHMDSVIDKMSKMVTQRLVAIHVLQFLASLSRLPDLYRNFRQLDYKRIFAVCQSYLQSTRKTTQDTEKPVAPSNASGTAITEDALPDYVYALAHHIVTFWYIAMNPHDRADLKPYITNFLTYKSIDGKETLEDQGIVTVDMMDRVDTEEESESYNAEFDETDGRILTQNRLAGLLLVTTKTSMRSGRTLVNVRRPSGNSWHLIDPIRTHGADRKRSLARITLDTNGTTWMSTIDEDRGGRVYGQVAIPRSSSILGATNVIILPEDDGARRAIASLDHTPALDSHKTGVIYVGEGQKTQDEILKNSSGSPDYRDLITDLGTLQRLKGAKFNTQGLDRQGDDDGEHAVVWNNKVTEIVYHITTLMPTTDDARENTGRKKRHIGNDFVNIVFNNSGGHLTYDVLYNIFPSDFGYVYIVITPASRTTFIQARTQEIQEKRDRFYRVQVLARHDYPNVSPASEEKIVSGVSLAGFVRNLALNDCIVSLMKSPRGEAGEYPSSWRYRMEQLRRIAERYREHKA